MLQYCLSDKPVVKDFIPNEMCTQEYPITEYQPVYFAANSFEDAKNKLRYCLHKHQLLTPLLDRSNLLLRLWSTIDIYVGK